MSKPQRVQIPAYTDRWMMGDRYGEVVKVVRKRWRETSRANIWRNGSRHIWVAKRSKLASWLVRWYRQR